MLLDGEALATCLFPARAGFPATRLADCHDRSIGSSIRIVLNVLPGKFPALNHGTAGHDLKLATKIRRGIYILHASGRGIMATRTCPEGFNEITPGELATTLAALRSWQNMIVRSGTPRDFADYFDKEAKALSTKKIDDFAEKLNTSKICIEK
jgi:hypothetical protein